MSGGHWDIEELVPTKALAKILEAVGECEHIMDWALSHDTSMEDWTIGSGPRAGERVTGARTDVWNRLEKLFDDLYELGVTRRHQ